jgi:hypothetical protein
MGNHNTRPALATRDRLHARCRVGRPCERHSGTVSLRTSTHCRKAQWWRWPGCGARPLGAMTLAERGAAEAAQQIAVALEQARLPYAIGGALALAIAGVPRGTADVDLNVFVDELRVLES